MLYYYIIHIFTNTMYVVTYKVFFPLFYIAVKVTV